MEGFLSALIAGVTSGTVISAILGILFHKSMTTMEAEIKNQFNESLEVFKSTREWKEKSVSELLGPICIQLDRTKRAFERWKEQNLFLEAKVIGVGNQTACERCTFRKICKPFYLCLPQSSANL